MGKGNSKLTQEDIDDMIKETEFTESELKVWHFPCLLLLPPPVSVPRWTPNMHRGYHLAMLKFSEIKPILFIHLPIFRTHFEE